MLIGLWFVCVAAYGCGKLYHPNDPKDFDEGRSWTAGKWGSYNGQGGCGNSGNTSWEAANNKHGCALRNGTYTEKEVPDVSTLSQAQGWLAEAKAEHASSGRKFWLGVGFVKPHMPQAFPEVHAHAHRFMHRHAPG